MIKQQAGAVAIGGVVVATLLASTLQGRGFWNAQTGLDYIVEAARVDDLELTILASGAIEPQLLVNVGAQVSGRLEKLAVKVGDKVRAGQFIGQIDSIPQRNALRDAEASLGNVRAQRLARIAALRHAELQFARQEQLWAADAAPREDFEAARALLDTTRAEIQALDAQILQAEVTVDIARADLSYTRITAPASGVVVAVVTEEGRTVNANQSAPTIVMLAQLDVMKVKAEISEADVTRVRAGQKVYFTTLGEPDKRHYAVLQTVEPAPASIARRAESQSSSQSSTDAAIYYNGLFEMPNPDGALRPSMTAQVHIVLDEVRQTLLIPAGALGERAEDGRYEVRVAGTSGLLDTRQVRIGLNNKVAAQVLDGLEAGERVVVGDAKTRDSGKN